MSISVVKHEHKVTYAGDIVTTIEGGQKLKINSTGTAGQLLNWTAPAGETWEAMIVVWLEKQ
jgi:hypothetical protein